MSCLRLECSFTSVQPGSYCEMYPVINYTLVVNRTWNEEIMASALASSAENNIIIFLGNLSGDSIYSFRILVANSVGVFSTSHRYFC